MSVYAQGYGYFFNSNSGDRKYNAESFEEWLKPFFISGVFNGSLQVTAQSTPDMTVNVAGGYANLDGKAAKWTGTNVLTLSPASGVYNRIDTIVLRRDNTNRTISIEVVAGTASLSPTPTPPTRDSDIFELVLAQIYVGVGVTAIAPANITDTRMDSTICGWVAATVDQIDFDQIKAQFDGWLDDTEDEFTDWYNHIKGQLDEDAAGHLQNEVDDLQDQIDANDGDIADLKSDLGVVEDGDTAAHAISKGQYVIWKCKLYTADAAITIGETLASSGGSKNLTAVSGGGLNALNGNKANKSVTVTKTMTEAGNFLITHNDIGLNGSNRKTLRLLSYFTYIGNAQRYGYDTDISNIYVDSAGIHGTVTGACTVVFECTLGDTF